MLYIRLAPKIKCKAKWREQTKITGQKASLTVSTNGQQPRSVLTACIVDKGVKSDTPPSGDEWSLARHCGERLKWRYHSRMTDYYAQWAGHYNGVRYLLRYAHRQTVRPQLMPISECVKRTTDTSSGISQQFLVTTETYDGSLDSLHDVSSLTLCGRSANDKTGYNAFPETLRKCKVDLPRPPAVGLSSTPLENCQKSVRKPKYNCIRGSKKFTGCMQSKRKLSMETCNNRHDFCTSNSNVEPLWIGGEEMLQRQFHSNAKPCVQIQQSTLVHVAAPAVDATADRNLCSVRMHASARHASSYVNFLANTTAYSWSVCSISKHGISAGNRMVHYSNKCSIPRQYVTER